MAIDDDHYSSSQCHMWYIDNRADLTLEICNRTVWTIDNDDKISDLFSGGGLDDD